MRPNNEPFPSATSPIDLVIFDCDGVLVDSEPIALAVLQDSIAACGVTLDLETVQRRFQGRSLDAIAADLEAQGIAFDVARQSDMNTALLARFSRDLRPIAGMPALVDRLAVRACVASSSRTDRLQHSLAVTGLLGRFEGSVFSADAVPRGKPHPDLFLFAAARMGTAPDRCLVIEDSVPGVEAAHAARMPVIGFAGGGHLQDRKARKPLEAVANTLASNVDDLAEQLKRHGLLGEPGGALT